MNPNAIRIWLMACGEQFGINQAHEYRWPDADRHDVPYCTYRPLTGEPSMDGALDLSDSTAYVSNEKFAQEHVQRFQVDLYRSQNGLYELEAFCIAAYRIQSLRDMFDTYGCQFADIESVTDRTTFDDERIDYHHELICVFREFVEINIDNVNGVVNQIDLTLETDSPTFSIDDDGISVT